MKYQKKKLIIILAIPVFILTGFCFWQTPRLNNHWSLEAAPITSLSYNSLLFQAAIAKFPPSNKEGGNKVVALIAPHHDLAADYTAELFQKIGRRKIKTVIIVGPNHLDRGAGDIITGLVAYNYLNNNINSNAELVNNLIKDKIAVSDPDRLADEHSIYNLSPYIKYYFPEAELVPIILSSRVSEKQAQQLGDYLAAYINDETIIIGSVDFSHYLSTEEANLNDAVSQTAILKRDYNKIYSLNNDYLDSPATLVTVLRAAKTVNANEVTIVRNSNLSAAVGAGSVANSTSYFTILLHH